MTKKTSLRTYIKHFNKEVLKLSWIYILAISLLLIVLVQLYRTSTSASSVNQPTTMQKLEQEIQTLKQTVQTQEMQIQQLQNDIEHFINK
ncbi:hypothetical protein GMA11_01490 [Granulicatella sp. zg-ZJ]|uniref:hypothetical protein n=1 Tax=unclassified Granulicatella TaxID=2630493 RepID=UPI0013C1727E|nr:MULTISPECIES: hypothetical protein [unclassified Granulicatella]MBS4749944.1 hypothetical protein [Carnobacteriaceae bacterium zg-ZUI78]NEW62058.1 hypothetical protein [Granulicatella sp. zg-ZJ]NEW66144.1 hypothetical protein [Granulicatella sp. zg-84]QMI86099.1 hypothetical protein H1220_01625 [Carnobacteriaceae bacterium zg-84]